MSRLDDAVAEYMRRKRDEPAQLAENVVRLHPINTTRYRLRWQRDPAGRSEIWCVTRPNYRGAFYHEGSFAALEREYRDRPGDWYLVPVAQVEYPAVSRLNER